jgi:hypothetical protein
MKTIAHQRDKVELVDRLRVLRPDSVRRWGRMSVHQMVCHLCDGFRMGTGEKSVRPVVNPFRRTMVKWIALYVPVPWPPGIRTRPEIDQELLGTTPVDFAADVAQLQGLLDQVTAQSRNFEWQSHPIFGSMSEAAWLRWGYLHVDHHLRQFGA